VRPGVPLIGVLLGLAGGGCSGRPGSGSEKAAERDSDGGVVRAALMVPSPLPLGKAEVDEFGYRRGPGRGEFDRAVQIEKRARDASDWREVVAACRSALAADPGHLDASWLLAAALARLGEHDAILEPLSTAVAGDWAKWGERSLALPLFRDFLASPSGEAWRQLAEQYRAAFAQSARRALVVLAHELYGWDPETGRWLRLTRTSGTVVAALPGPQASGLIAYVAYRDLARPGDQRGAVARPGVAVVELASGKASREIGFDEVGELRLAWRPGQPGDAPAIAVAIDRGRERGVWLLEWEHGHRKHPAAKTKVTLDPDQLIVARGRVQHHRAPVPGVTADWDDDGLASAIRLDATRKTVSPPEGLLVDGHELVWSADRSRLALVAARDGDCAAAEAVFVVDAATGKLRRIGDAPAPAPAWVDDRRLAYTAGDHVVIVDASSARVERELISTGGVATANVDRACAAHDEEILFVSGGGEEEDILGDTEPPADAGAAPP